MENTEISKNAYFFSYQKILTFKKNLLKQCYISQTWMNKHLFMLKYVIFLKNVKSCTVSTF